MFVELHCNRQNSERTTKGTKRLLINNFAPRLGRVPLNDITPQQITDILDKMADTPSEANHSFAAIRKFFNWCCQRHLITASPCSMMTMPYRTRSRSRVLADDELLVPRTT